MSIFASRGDLFLVVDEDGKVVAFPSSAVADVVKILTTPAKARRSELTGGGIRERIVTLQPGEEGHAAASLRAAGFEVLENRP